MKPSNALGSGWRTRGLGERDVERHVRVEHDQRFATAAPGRRKSIRLSRRFCCLISPARASSVSRSPNSLMSCAAVLTPMPGTPGTLSVESPISACTSITLSGGTPKRSMTSASPITLVLHRVVHA